MLVSKCSDCPDYNLTDNYGSCISEKQQECKNKNQLFCPPNKNCVSDCSDCPGYNHTDHDIYDYCTNGSNIRGGPRTCDSYGQNYCPQNDHKDLGRCVASCMDDFPFNPVTIGNICWPQVDEEEGFSLINK